MSRRSDSPPILCARSSVSWRRSTVIPVPPSCSSNRTPTRRSGSLTVATSWRPDRSPWRALPRICAPIRTCSVHTSGSRRTAMNLTEDNVGDYAETLVLQVRGGGRTLDYSEESVRTLEELLRVSDELLQAESFPETQRNLVVF